MKKPRNQFFVHIVNFITIALIVECFLCSLMLINKYGEESCYDRIEETTTQIATMFSHAMDDNQQKLTVLADILAANSSNTDEYLIDIIEQFCETQYFSTACIHRANGTSICRELHPHALSRSTLSFEAEAAKLPYTSNLISTGETRAEKYIYQAVPIVRDGETVAILYGFISLSTFPEFIDSTAYDGNCQFYIVDGDSGDFLMDEYHYNIGNLYDSSFGQRQTKNGYTLESMKNGVRHGDSGFYVFMSQRTGEWYYTYYMPLGINNWSMQLTIDEPTAFASYQSIIRSILFVAVGVIILMVLHVLVLMIQTGLAKARDKANLHQSQYISEIQRALINAYTHTDMISKALGTIAAETKSETVLLLAFDSKTVSDVYYWPSKDIDAAAEMLGRNIRLEFPAIYDLLLENRSSIYSASSSNVEISESAKQLFEHLDIRNAMIVPITDNAGLLKGALCAVNSAERRLRPEMLECVTYDFFMTLTNVENDAIIRSFGTMDYMTGVKNRNSFESELTGYSNADRSSLWCVYVDVNGLHNVNNTLGHKAGDAMLCAVADSLKEHFGKEFTYRIGGDEFVAFAFDKNSEELEAKKREIIASLKRSGYHVSIGFEGGTKGQSGVFELDAIVSEAEALMYRDKNDFYERNHLSHDRDSSQLPLGAC